MTDWTPHQQAIAYLVAAYPVPSWEPETVKLYTAEVADIPARAVQAAVREWARSADNRPSLAELRRAALGVVRRARSAARRRALMGDEPATLERCDPQVARKLLADIRQTLDRGRGLRLVGGKR